MTPVLSGDTSSSWSGSAPTSSNVMCGRFLYLQRTWFLQILPWIQTNRANPVLHDHSDVDMIRKSRTVSWMTGDCRLLHQWWWFPSIWCFQWTWNASPAPSVRDSENLCKNQSICDISHCEQELTECWTVVLHPHHSERTETMYSRQITDAIDQDRGRQVSVSAWVPRLEAFLTFSPKIAPWSPRWFEEISVALIWLALIWLALIWVPFLSKFLLFSLNIHNLGTHLAHTQMDQIWPNKTFTYCFTTISTYQPKELPGIHL